MRGWGGGGDRELARVCLSVWQHVQVSQPIRDQDTLIKMVGL